MLYALLATQFVAVDLGLQIGTGAACWVDLNNDGWPDLVGGGGIWRNEKGKAFTKIGASGEAVAADFDNDGFADLFSWSQMKLYRNEKGLSFTEVPLPALPETTSRGACWGDFNNDGFVDLYVGGFEGGGRSITYPDFLLMNEGGKSFRLQSKEAVSKARGVTACDFDRDGDLDIYISNYRLEPNRLLVNDGNAGFRDQAGPRNAIATSDAFAGGHSIGAAWGDFDNDGEFDLFAGNFAHVDSRGDQPKSRFLRNLGRGSYRFDDKGTSGVFYQESYATPSAGDYDNDGRLDLFFTTVYLPASFGRPNHPVLFRNAADFDFKDVTKDAGVAELPPTYQAAWADYDRDGDLDLVSAGKLFQNQGAPGNRWITMTLRGDGKRVNRLAIGAQVRIRVGDKILSRQVEAGTGEGNQNDLTLHFGLGADKTKTFDAEIVWPGGVRQTVKGLAPNKHHTISPSPRLR